jgi:NAD+ kinase
VFLTTFSLHFWSQFAYDSSAIKLPERKTHMTDIALIYKRTRPDALALAQKLRNWLERQHIEVFCQQNAHYKAPEKTNFSKPEIPQSTELVVVLGGDGTFLSVARLLENRSIPIIGVNIGGLGFLTEIPQETCFEVLEEILNGRYDVEERMRLQVSIQRDQKIIFEQTVLNDAVINKGTLARIINIKVTIDGHYLTDYRADGLIVATPTGSTAYNLSAGGPIIYPTTHAMIINPICSFTLTNRPIILPSDMQIEVKLKEHAEEVILTCDGQVGHTLSPFDRVLISVAPNPLRLIKPLYADYFEILRTKLKWG